MRFIMKNTNIIYILLLSLSVSFAGIKEDFFHSGLSAKALALGGTAFGFGVDSIYSNPAGLAVIPDKYYTYSYKSNYDQMIGTMVFNYMDTHGRDAWGIGLIHMDNSNADKSIINEFDRPDVQGKYGERQIGISAAYAKPIWGDSAIGLGARLYLNQLDDESAYALGFYCGYIKKIRYDWLFGISINNISLSSRLLGTPINWSTGHVDYFPLKISTSIAHRKYLFKKQTEFFADIHLEEVTMDRNFEKFFSVGALVWFVPKTFNGRFGISDESFSLGAGLRLNEWGIDYAYRNHQYLGNSHLISFSYKPDIKKPNITYKNMVKTKSQKTIPYKIIKNVEIKPITILKSPTPDKQIIITQNITMNIKDTITINNKISTSNLMNIDLPSSTNIVASANQTTTHNIIETTSIDKQISGDSNAK